MNDHLDMQTPNGVSQNIEKIAQLFPHCVTETHNGLAIDFDLLKQELSQDIVEGIKERYRLEWPGKREAITMANLPTQNTLRPEPAQSVDFDKTQNLYIEGDNLEVLKLLQESYLGKVKMIYIDPPYNTGKDFVYKDNFTQDTEEYQSQAGLRDEQNNRLVANPDTSGRYHSDWLSMMYPRLKLARNLLTDDGVIFISIDDNEVHNLRKICDEIFGEVNFVDVLKWKRKKQPSFLATHTAKVMEYIYVYSRNKTLLEKISIDGTSDFTKKVINISNSETIRVFNPNVRVKGINSAIIKSGIYKIKTMEVEYLNDVIVEEGRTKNFVNVKSKFSVSQEKIDYFIEKDLLFITNQKGLRRDVSDEEIGKRKSITDLLLSEYGDNQESDKEFLELFKNKYFDYTKPIKLIKNLVKSVFTDGEIILDFFSGSSTTAHAVMQLNAEDNGSRRYIMVQLPEKIEIVSGDNEEQKKVKQNAINFLNELGKPALISEIGKERIRRAAKKIQAEKEEKAKKDGLFAGDFKDEQDYGFRVFRLDTSNMEDVFYLPKDLEQNQLDLFADNLKPDRSPLDLLTQIMLDWGLPLSLPIEKTTIAGKEVFRVNHDALFACFDNGIDETFAKEIAPHKPLRIVFRDRSFKDDTAKENVKQLLHQLAPETEMKVL